MHECILFHLQMNGLQNVCVSWFSKHSEQKNLIIISFTRSPNMLEFPRFCTSPFFALHRVQTIGARILHAYRWSFQLSCITQTALIRVVLQFSNKQKKERKKATKAHHPSRCENGRFWNWSNQDKFRLRVNSVRFPVLCRAWWQMFVLVGSKFGCGHSLFPN